MLVVDIQFHMTSHLAYLVIMVIHLSQERVLFVYHILEEYLAMLYNFQLPDVLSLSSELTEVVYGHQLGL